MAENITERLSDLSPAAVALHFEKIGGKFIASPEKIKILIGDIEAIVLDWDGVFNCGQKGSNTFSQFSEADSMGLNMLRYGLWLQNKTLPPVALISGEKNQNAGFFAKREHLHHIYLGVQDKCNAANQFCKQYRIKPERIMFIFDDINDMSLAKKCNLRCMVNRTSSPLLENFAVGRNLCDYITGSDCSGFAIREISEMLLGLIGIYETVLESRIACDANYKNYFEKRQNIVTQTS